MARSGCHTHSMSLAYPRMSVLVAFSPGRTEPRCRRVGAYHQLCNQAPRSAPNSNAGVDFPAQTSRRWICGLLCTASMPARAHGAAGGLDHAPPHTRRRTRGQGSVDRGERVAGQGGRGTSWCIGWTRHPALRGCAQPTGHGAGQVRPRPRPLDLSCHDDCADHDVF